MNYGLGHLTKTIMNSTSMIHVDNSSSLVYKRAAASVVVASASLGATFVGYKQIPISKYYILAHIEIGMIKMIQKIYGIKAPNNFIDAIVDDVLNNYVEIVKAAVLKELAKRFKSSSSKSDKNESSSYFSWTDKIFKYFSNGPLAAATSGIVTASLGGVYMNIMENAYKGKINFDMNNEEAKMLAMSMLNENLHDNKLLDKYIAYAY